MLRELDLVSDLLAVARCDGFTAAAAERHISVSTLSRRIARLESQVGSRLVERASGGYDGLTAAGERVAVDAERLLRVAAALVRVAHEPATRTVRVGVPGMLADHGAESVWRMLQARVAAEVPGVRLAVRSVPFAACESALDDHRVDVMMSQVDPASRGIEPTPLGAVPRILVTGRDHPLAGRPSVSVAEVVDLPLLREATAPARWFRPWVLGDLRPPASRRLVPVRAPSFAQAAVSLTGRVATVTSGTFLESARSRWAAAIIADAPPMILRADVRRADRLAGMGDAVRILADAFARPPAIDS